jgi:hypothetical protein
VGDGDGRGEGVTWTWGLGLITKCTVKGPFVSTTTPGGGRSDTVAKMSLLAPAMLMGSVSTT